MRLASVLLCVLLGASSLVPSDVGAATAGNSPARSHHRHTHRVHRPTHPVHKAVHPVRRPGHRPAVTPPGARRTVVIGVGHRPVHPWWRPGGAIAAGAAIGFVAATTAASWAGSPPGPTYCWFYTDLTRTNGFWDLCPP